MGYVALGQWYTNGKISECPPPTGRGVSCEARRGVGYNDHPVAQSAPPLRRGELYSATVRSQFPSIGGVTRARAPRDVSRGWLGRGGQRIQEKTLTLLTCHSRAGGNRAVVVISYLIGGIILCCVFIITKSAIRI